VPQLKPNINETGASARLNASRVVLILAALSLLIPGLPRWLTLTIFSLLVIAGLFLRFEAKKRWCALRACGIKTPR